MSLKPMCKMTQKSNMIENCEPDCVILLIPAKKHSITILVWLVGSFSQC